jgi:hypothetical protein
MAFAMSAIGTYRALPTDWFSAPHASIEESGRFAYVDMKPQFGRTLFFDGPHPHINAPPRIVPGRFAVYSTLPRLRIARRSFKVDFVPPPPTTRWFVDVRNVVVNTQLP